MLRGRREGGEGKGGGVIHAVHDRVLKACCVHLLAASCELQKSLSLRPSVRACGPVSGRCRRIVGASVCLVLYVSPLPATRHRRRPSDSATVCLLIRTALQPLGPATRVDTAAVSEAASSCVAFCL